VTGSTSSTSPRPRCRSAERRHWWRSWFAPPARAQFVVATHSPILLAWPEAQIYELGARGITPCAYDHLDLVRLTRGFLDDPDRYVRAALGEPDEA
jgi:hypothetical protein